MTFTTDSGDSGDSGESGDSGDSGFSHTQQPATTATRTSSALSLRIRVLHDGARVFVRVDLHLVSLHGLRRLR